MSLNRFSLFSKLLRLVVAWVLGSGIYFLYAIATVYDGILSIICQPFMAMFFSAAIVFLSFIVGLPLMLLTQHRPKWLAMSIAAVSFIIGLSLLIFPDTFSPMFEWLFPAVQEILNSVVFIPVYLGAFIVIFTVVNWPKMNIISSQQNSELN